MNTLDTIAAVRALHASEAQALDMVYEVWEDGEITLTKGGALYGQRGVHCTRVGFRFSLPIDSLPKFNGAHSCIQVLTSEDADRARELILDWGRAE